MRFRPTWSAVWRLLTLAICYGTPAWGTKLEIRWSPVEGAEAYEIELTLGKKTVVAKRFDAKTLHWRTPLDPGAYFYRVRAIDRVERAGEWSDPQLVPVLPLAASWTSPVSGQQIAWARAEKGLNLAWTKSKGAHHYRIEIHKGEEKILEEVTSELSWTWKPSEAGPYRLSVRAMLKTPKGESAVLGSPPSLINIVVIPKPVPSKLRELTNVIKAEPPPPPLPSSSMEWLIQRKWAVSIASGLNPYKYHLTTGYYGGANTDTSGVAASVRLAGEYWWLGRLGSGLSLDNRFFQMDGIKGSSTFAKLDLRYRFGLEWGAVRFVLMPYVGYAQYDMIRPDPNITYQTVTNADSSTSSVATVTGTRAVYSKGSGGPFAGLSLYSAITPHFGLSLDGMMYVPYLGQSGNSEKVVTPLSYPTFAIKVAPKYQFASRWNLIIGASYEVSQLKTQYQDQGAEYAKLSLSSVFLSLECLFR